MSLGPADKIVGAAIVTDEYNQILVVTEKGFGKRSTIDEYRLQGRGGSGVKTLNVTDKNGALVALKSVNDMQDLIITTDKGVIIRMHISDISQTGRATQGVKLIRLKDDQSIATVAVVAHQEEENGEDVASQDLQNTINKEEVSE